MVITVLIFIAYGVIHYLHLGPEEIHAATAKEKIETIFSSINATIATIARSRPVILVVIVLLAVSSLVFRKFIAEHPGVVLVFLGVAGETI